MNTTKLANLYYKGIDMMLPFHVAYFGYCGYKLISNESKHTIRLSERLALTTFFTITYGVVGIFTATIYPIFTPIIGLCILEDSGFLEK